MMGMIDNFRYRLSAALSPKQMTTQYSKSKLAEDELAFTLQYRGTELNFEDYNKMLMDPQIRSGYELIRMFLLSRKLIVTPASEDEQDIEIANTLEKMLDSMDYPMRKVRNDMYSALIYGYSVSEMVWGMEEGDENISIDRIRPIPIETLEHCFRYNKDGDVETVVQIVDGEEIEIPAEKCLIYTYDECFGKRYGTSILDGVYDNWYMKQKILNWWNVFLQKHEGPTLAGFVENPAYKELFRDQLDEIREGRANITSGVNDRNEVIESTHRGEGFKDAIDYHDVMIFRKMNISTKILGQQDGSGAYAQSQTQFDTLNIFLDGVHEDIAAELQSKVIKLVDMNWNVEEYPVVSFETFEEKDLLGLLEAIKPLIDSGAIDPQDVWFKHLVADVVGRYSDVDLSELLEEDTEEIIPGASVQPTSTEQQEPTSQEQADLITQVKDTMNQGDTVQAVNADGSNYTQWKASSMLNKKPTFKVIGKVYGTYGGMGWWDIKLNGKSYSTYGASNYKPTLWKAGNKYWVSRAKQGNATKVA